MSDLPVIFGMGAARAGQTWLFRALSKSPDVRSTPIEELHYWDTFAPRDAAEQVKSLNERATLLTERQGWDGPGLDLAELAAMLAYDRTGDNAYRSYLAAGAGIASQPGAYALDFTPSYSMLSIAELERMVAFSTRSMFLFLMRDPVERLWSHARMNATRRLRSGEDLNEKANFVLRRALQGLEGHIMARSDYSGAIRRLRAVVPAGRLCLIVSEIALNPQGVKQLCKALRIAPVSELPDVPPFTSSLAGINAPLLRAARWQLRTQYDAVGDILGEIPACWLPENAESAEAHERAMT